MDISIQDVSIKELVRHHDERGYFEELIRVSDEFFKEGFGQLSRSMMYPGVIKAWHIHKTQIDWWFVPRGTLKVALYDMRPQSPTYKKQMEFFLGEQGLHAVVKIPAGIAHGCKAVSGTCELFYVTSGIYSKEEEGRIPHDDPTIGYDWVKGPDIT